MKIIMRSIFAFVKVKIPKQRRKTMYLMSSMLVAASCCGAACMFIIELVSKILAYT